MVNKSKILSDLSKMAVDAMSTFSSMRKEIETLINLKVDKIIKKMNLVKRDEFEVLKKMVQKLLIENQKLKKSKIIKKKSRPTIKKKVIRRKKSQK